MIDSANLNSRLPPFSKPTTGRCIQVRCLICMEGYPHLEYKKNSLLHMADWNRKNMKANPRIGS